MRLFELMFPQPLLYTDGVSRMNFAGGAGGEIPYHETASPVPNIYEAPFNSMLAPFNVYTQNTITPGFRDGVDHFNGPGPMGEHYSGPVQIGEH